MKLKYYLIVIFILACIIFFRNVGVGYRSPVTGVVLTFDDGPSENTERVLDILKEKGVKAHFFFIGEKVLQYEDTVRRATREGHVLGVHGYTHDLMLFYGPVQNYWQLSTAKEEIQRVSGVQVQFYRPPYGWQSPITLLQARQLNLTSVGWTVIPFDYATRNTTLITKRVLNNIASGDVILLHDGIGNHNATLEALPEIIDGILMKNLTIALIDTSQQ